MALPIRYYRDPADAVQFDQARPCIGSGAAWRVGTGIHKSWSRAH